MLDLGQMDNQAFKGISVFVNVSPLEYNNYVNHIEPFVLVF